MPADKIDHKARQTAALVIFPKGVSKARAEQIMKKFQSEFRNPNEEPETVGVQEFNPTYGGICIYQP